MNDIRGHLSPLRPFWNCYLLLSYYLFNIIGRGFFLFIFVWNNRNLVSYFGEAEVQNPVTDKIRSFWRFWATIGWVLLSQLLVVAGRHGIVLCVDTSPQFLPPYSNCPLLCVSLSISYKDKLVRFQSPLLIQYDFILISTLITSPLSFIYFKTCF